MADSDDPCDDVSGRDLSKWLIQKDIKKIKSIKTKKNAF